jgi:hypothetical protein
MAKGSGAISGAASGAAAGTAILPGWGTAIGAGVGLIGGMMSENEASEREDAANRLRDEALAQYTNIDIPDIEKMKLYMEEMKSAGQLSPEMEQALLLGPSAMENIQVDPRLRAEQMQSLEGLSQASRTGMTDADMASLELIRRNSAAESQAKQNQILQNMQQRGQGGSGAELIASLQNAQSSADRENAQSLQEAKQMQANKMAALQQLGSMSSNMRNQDVGEQSQIAHAKDVINQFNLQNQQNIGQRNVGSRNTAQQANLQNQQRIMDANTLLHNQQQQHNKGLSQQQFNNQLNLANARSNVMTGNANQAMQQAANIAGGWGQTMQGIGTAANVIGQGIRNNQKPYQQESTNQDPEVVVGDQRIRSEIDDPYSFKNKGGL